VKLFPVAFETGYGCVLTDVDGNRYIDFSSGIYVATLGHCHPKISEALAKQARQLMNVHDFTTPVKTLLLEKLAEVLPGDLGGFQFYDCGSAAVEAGMRVLRAATGRNEMISCFYDFHGKTYGRCRWRRFDRRCMAACARRECTWCRGRTRIALSGRRRMGRLTPTSIWSSTESTSTARRSTMSPASSWSLFRAGAAPSCRRTIFSEAPRVLRCPENPAHGRRSPDKLVPHGQVALHGALGVVPDIVSIGKGFGNGFPVTCVAVREPFKESFEKISASSSYGGNPMACAAALACIEVIEAESLNRRSLHLGDMAMRRMKRMMDEHRIIGDVRAKGC